ncbi:MAG TPA: 2-oxo-4-hydroxy-4-carboxy-5-ureidoimidazoline decarboxylase, partial [Terriglobales bacterium]|nr:2-oxo-4-hydroxy-4-carboxy-5-ureidoimidazoline decarboxylase [Terriglobales bacterium]
TLAGNIVNASPAADSLPMLLVYEAELILISVRGERRMPYRDFHTGYKQMALEPDELIRAVCLTRSPAGYVSYARKVGTRNAQAISKVAIAGLGKIEQGVVQEIRLAVGSVAPVPLRLTKTEHTLKGKRLDPAAIALASTTAVSEISPISDIRSTAQYRAAVVRNLVEEFLEKLSAKETNVSRVLAYWNNLSAEEAENEIIACCGSWAWAREMVKRRPIATEAELLSLSREVWTSLSQADWKEAFRSHPRIGESRAQNPVEERRSAAWSREEQSGLPTSDNLLQRHLAEANRRYENRFGHIFIVCATGKSAAEILEILNRRLENDASTELEEAAEQQRQITDIRLKKWLTKK